MYFAGRQPLLHTPLRPGFGCPVALSAVDAFAGQVAPAPVSYQNPHRFTGYPMVFQICSWLRMSWSFYQARAVGMPASSPHAAWFRLPKPEACILLSTSLSTFRSNTRFSAVILPLRVVGFSTLSQYCFRGALTILPPTFGRAAQPVLLVDGITRLSSRTFVGSFLCQLVFLRLLCLFQLRPQLLDLPLP